MSSKYKPISTSSRGRGRAGTVTSRMSRGDRAHAGIAANAKRSASLFSTRTSDGFCIADAGSFSLTSTKESLASSTNGVASRPLRAEAPIGELLRCYWRVLPLVVEPELLRSPWCLQSAKVTELVFAQFGHTVEPMVVRSTLLNAAALRSWGVPHVSMPAGQLPQIGHAGADEADDEALHGGAWYGHLVAIVARRYLVDAAQRQGHSVGRGVYTPEVLVTDVARSLMVGRPAGILFRHGVHVTGIRFTPRDPDPNLDRVPGRHVTAFGRSVDIAAAVADRMRQELGVR
jgi:hypothetical protein